MFTHAIVKKPCHTMIYGITTANLGQPDYDLAMKQHAAYIDALQQCGVQVTILEAEEAFPDSLLRRRHRCFDTKIRAYHKSRRTFPQRGNRVNDFPSSSSSIQKITSNISKHQALWKAEMS